MRFILLAGVGGFVVPFPRSTAPEAFSTAPQLDHQLVVPQSGALPGRIAYYYEGPASAPAGSSPSRPQALVGLFLGACAGLALGSLAASRPSLAAVGGADADEEVSFSFGDAADAGDSTVAAIVEEERELTDKEKEIARLRAAETFMQKATGNAKCQVCGYVYKWDSQLPVAGLPPKTPFALVPEDWACPNCKAPKAFFDAETIEIAGFADNQAYGFGTNTWTEAQKSNAIFGGLGLFFILFVGGYALN